MITKDNILKVMELFFKCPEKNFHLREIARLTNLSLPGVKKIIWKLEKEKLLITKREKIFVNVYATRNQKFIDLKRSHNLYALSDLREYLKNIYEEPEAIIVFGSFSRGEDISKSDIDIAVITPTNKTTNLTKFENKLSRKINLFEIQLKKSENSFLNSLANGIVLSGNLNLLE